MRNLLARWYGHLPPERAVLMQRPMVYDGILYHWDHCRSRGRRACLTAAKVGRSRVGARAHRVWTTVVWRGAAQRVARWIISEVLHGLADARRCDPEHAREQVVDRIEHARGAARIGVELSTKQVLDTGWSAGYRRQRTIDAHNGIVKEAEGSALVAQRKELVANRAEEAPRVRERKGDQRVGGPWIAVAPVAPRPR